MSLTPGTRLGPYEIQSAIGAGGMGEVYRARDTKLGRDVAVKVVSESFAHDAERIARFHREAQLLAALNHPNIATIHGLEDTGDTQFLVMELVEGETLAQRVKSGPIPVGETLLIVRQVADALQAAHEKGIIHRDLKPANIALTADGQVKVLDFGLAKAVEPAQAGADGNPALTHSPTLSLAMTQAGMILGTAAYMAPEQARGRPADKRSDIWAFGCVLYEMLTGKRPFVGEDASETLAFVMAREPDWNLLPQDMPPAIRRLLTRCLEKDRKERLPDIGAARLEIKDTLAQPRSDADPGMPPATGRRDRLAWGIAAASLMVAAAALGVTFSRTGAPMGAPELRLHVTPPGRIDRFAIITRRTAGRLFDGSTALASPARLRDGATARGNGGWR